jgi:hypothetical protein
MKFWEGLSMTGVLAGWWDGLTVLNRGFYAVAIFFGVIFVWQLAASIFGISGGDESPDSTVDTMGAHHVPADTQETLTAFKLMSVRSILAFFTLFFWAGSLYLNNGVPLTVALLWSLVWGSAALVLISLIMNGMQRMQETGNVTARSSVGNLGTVHLDIPAGGQGEVRVMCREMMMHLKARDVDGKALKAGTTVTVIRVLEPTVVEVRVKNAGETSSPAGGG